MTDRYPTTDDEPGPLDGLVPFLREADATHQEKALALLGAARTEYRYAVTDGQIDSGFEFLSWVRDVLPVMDAVIEKVREEQN